MRFWHDMKLQRKLLLVYALGAVLPILVIGIHLSFRVYAITFDSAMQAHTASLTQLRENYANFFENCERAMRSVSQDAKLLAYVNRRHDTDFDAIQGFLSDMRPIVRGRDRGVGLPRFRLYSDNPTIYFSQELGSPLEALSKEGWYDPDARGPQLQWVYTSTLGGTTYRPMVGCYQPLMSSGYPHAVRRVSAMFFDEEPLHQLVSTERGFGYRVFLLNALGAVVSTTEREMLFRASDELPLGAGESLQLAQAGQILRYAGEPYYCLKTPLGGGGMGPRDWQLVSLVPAQGIHDAVNRALTSALILCVSCLLFGVLLIVFTARSIRARVSRLNRNMNEVVESHFTAPVPVTGQDEIGDIERNFQAVAEQTRALIHEVYQINLNNAQLRAQNTDAQLIALRGQINPHYLFNTLESIRMNLIVSGDRRTANIIHLFAESFRSCIEGGDDERYDLGRELQFLNAYFAIQDYRTRGRVRFVSDLSDEALRCAIPKLLLQPLVENAVYHGLELKEGAGTIELSARVEHGMLMISVRDDGVGMDEDTLGSIRAALDQSASACEGEYLALRNVNARLKLQYGESHALAIESAPGMGTTVRLRLPARRVPSAAPREGN